MIKRVLFIVALGALCTVPLLGCQPAKLAGLPDPGPNGVALVVQTTPKGAAIVVDGVRVGTGPANVKLRPGAHTFKATLSGYFAADQHVSVSAQGSKTVTLTLVASH